MRDDWEQVQALARDLGDTKWQYRALAQLGLVAFYDGDLATARKNVGGALAAATAAGDAGAQIRYLTELGLAWSSPSCRTVSPLSRQSLANRERYARRWLSIPDLRAALGRTDRPETVRCRSSSRRGHLEARSRPPPTGARGPGFDSDRAPCFSPGHIPNRFVCPRTVPPHPKVLD